MKKQSQIALAIILIISIIGCVTTPTGHVIKEPEPIKLGIIAPLTGPVAYWGEPSLRTAELAIKQINEKGGINGRPLALEVYDDEIKQNIAVDALNQLMHAKKVNKIIQFAGATTAATAPLAEGKAIILNPSTRPENMYGRYYHVFNIGQSAFDEMGFLADYIYNNLKMDKVAFIYQQDPYGQTYKNGFTSSFQGTVYEFGYDQYDFDYRGTVAKLKEKNAQAIITSLNPGQVVALMQQIRQLGATQEIFINWAGESEALIQKSHGLAEGVIFSYPFKPSDDPKDIELYELFKENNIILHPLMFNTWDAVMLFAGSLEVCDENNLECIQNYIKHKEVDSPGGDFTFDNNNIAQRNIYIKKIVDGKFVYI